jgi:diacylglycerol kinase family enzyme
MFIARNPYQLDEFNVPGFRCVAEDGFSVFYLRPMNRMRLVSLALRALARKLQPANDFEMFCASSFRVDSHRIRRTVAFDGERVKMTAPLEFRVREQALLVAVPAAVRKDEVAA